MVRHHHHRRRHYHHHHAAEPHVLNNFMNCCTCVSDEAIDLSNVALLLLTDDTPVFIELIILIKPSKIPPFPVDDEDDDDGVLPVPVPVPVALDVVPVVATGTAPDVEDDSLLVVVDTCGGGCDKAFPNAGIGVPVVVPVVVVVAVAGCGIYDICCGDVGNGGCTGGDICCCCCICCHC